MKIVENPNVKLTEKIKEGLKKKNGHCPCVREISDKTLCMCEEFRLQIQDPDFFGYCRCMLYCKVKEEEK